MNYRGVANDQSESAIMPLRKSRDPIISYPKQVTFDEYSMLLVLGTDHVSDHALRFSSDVLERMYRLSFYRNCETLHPGVGLNGKSS